VEFIRPPGKPINHSRPKVDEFIDATQLNNKRRQTFSQGYWFIYCNEWKDWFFFWKIKIGAKAHRVNLARNLIPQFNGKGIKVGVLSDSVDHLEYVQVWFILLLFF